MKRLLILLALIFIPTCHEPGTAWAQCNETTENRMNADACPDEGPFQLARLSPAIVGGGVPAASGCTTPTGDEFTESFGDSSTAECWSGLGGTTCNQTWTVQAATPEIVSSPGTPITNTACSNSVLISTVATPEHINLAFSGIASTTAVTIGFSLYVSSSYSCAQWHAPQIVSWTTSIVNTATKYFAFYLKRSSAGTGVPQTFYVEGATSSKEFSLTTDTWYNIIIALDADAAAEGSSITVSGGLSDSDTFQRDTDADVDRLCVGVYTAAATAIFYVGNIYVTTP